jgi:TolA-binding protein
MSLGSRLLKLLLVLAALTIGSGCVYYNTFFMARQKFNDAEKSQEESRLNKLRLDDQSSARPSDNSQGRSSIPSSPTPRPQPGVVVSAVTQQERTLYEDAITKANLVLTLHPESKWVDDALWLIGKSNFNMAEFLKAEKSFKELVTNHPESKYVDDAYFYMGLSLINLDLKDQALETFANIENAPKKSPYLEYILYAKGNMELADENYTKAEEFYSKFLESYPSSDSAAMAMFNIGQCREKRKEYQAAYEAFGKVDKYSPSRRLHFDATLAQATAAIAGDSVAIGMKILGVLSKDDRYFSRAGEINLKSAEGYYLQGDIESAIKLYTDVTVQNPHTPQAAESYYRLGVIYQENKYDLTAAKAAFTKAQNEYSDSEFRPLALARSAQIAKLETYQIQLQKADSLSRLEELESLGQGEPESTSVQSHMDTLKTTVAIDSTNAIRVDTLTARDSISTVKPDSLIPTGTTPIILASDSLNQKKPDSSTSLQNIGNEPQTAPALDTTGFANLSPAERMKLTFNRFSGGDTLAGRVRTGITDSLKAPKDTVSIPAYIGPVNIRDSLTALTDTSHVINKDTLAVAKQSSPAEPPIAPAVSAKAIQDSIRQSIIQSGIETRFLLAELFAYELNRPDSALEEYLLISTEYPQSQYAPRALLAASQIKFAAGDSAGARELLTKLLSEYAQSPQANQAARELNSPTDPLNSIELYSTAENLVFSGENPDSAIVLYKYIADNDPDLAPKAAYAAAWTLDQVVGVEDSSAYYAYYDITKKYPHTEYATAANDRISAATKKSTRRPSQPQNQSPADSTSDETNPDSTMDLASGLPIAPKVIKSGVFIYPEALLSQDLRGKVIFKIKLSFSGKVEDYQMIGPFGQHQIDSTATEALLQTEFDVSNLDLTQLDGYFQYSISFKRPDINIYNDIYREQRDRGP